MRTTSLQSITLTLGLSLLGCNGTDNSGSITAFGGEQGLGGTAQFGGASAASGGSLAAVGTSVVVGGTYNGGVGGGSSLGGNSQVVGGAGGGSTQADTTVATGGKLAVGGSRAAGGTTVAGGTKAAGGTSSRGGSTAASGGSGTGGATAKGGSSSTGGTAQKPVEDEGLDCSVGALSEAGSLAAIAKLPDPFKRLDGTRIASKSDWRCRRQEIKKMAEKYAFGTKGIPQTVTGTVTSSTITVNVSEGGKSTSFSVSVSLPTAGSAPYPAVVVYGGLGADTTTIRAAGAAVISMDPYKLGAEGTGRAAKSGAYYSIYGASSTTGLLVAWGWGVSRIIDVIEKSDGKILRADGIGVTGCSRFGKGAFIAGVFDQRIALTMPIESGTAGVPIWRGVPGEGAQSLSSAYGEQPWFGDALSAFTSAPTKAPLDTHELVAMVAPRGLFIMDNPHIANLGPKSAHAAALAGAEVYKALGAGDRITYWSNVADGSHCAIRPEWKDPLTKSIQKYLLKTGTYTGVINAHSKATSTLATWVDWTTPALN